MSFTAAVGAPPGGPGVVVEVLLLRCSDLGGTALQYRTCSERLNGSTMPDGLAAQICADARDSSTQVPVPVPALMPVSGCVSLVHSTSWRFEVGVGVVLTYAALPDPDPAAPAVELVSPTVVCSEDPRRPQPPALHGHHVAAHAVRHLSELAGRDPTVAAAATEAGHAELWRRVHHTAAQAPTLTFRDAHPTPAHPRAYPH